MLASADQYTDQISADQQKQAQNNATLQQLQATIDSDKAQIPQLQAAIAQLTVQITTAKNEVAQAQAVLDHITADLNATIAHRDAVQRQLNQEKRQLSKELVVMYELQQQSTPLNNMLSANSFDEFWTAYVNSQRIGEQESATVNQVKEEESEIQADVALISTEQSEQQSAVNSKQAAQDQLEAAQEAQQTALAKVQADEAQSSALQQQIEAQNTALNSEIAQLNQEEEAAQSQIHGNGSGQFAWPDSGPITQGFGCTQYYFEPYDSSCPYPHRFHNGIDIAGACGNAILAAAAGTAYIQPWYPNGYGNYIIIDHGGGWNTLYGHMSGFAVSNGQQVSRGQQIGWEGS
ncbi:MAG: peptidoglycan DD-metalloendopeptidase family protein, partial [Candidatus Dormibacteraeota bacterium]|nr:peptidoglycan DD-metalloendopeptidase family protein [Candidatus Dormibacteraeota bacterium]